MNIISLYLAFDSNKRFVMMCSELDDIKKQINDKFYYEGDYEIRYIEFTNGDLVDFLKMRNNSTYIETIHKNDIVLDKLIIKK